MYIQDNYFLNTYNLNEKSDKKSKSNISSLNSFEKNALNIYLTEISKFPVLTRNKEVKSTITLTESKNTLIKKIAIYPYLLNVVISDYCKIYNKDKKFDNIQRLINKADHIASITKCYLDNRDLRIKIKKIENKKKEIIRERIRNNNSEVYKHLNQFEFDKRTIQRILSTISNHLDHVVKTKNEIVEFENHCNRYNNSILIYYRGIKKLKKCLQSHIKYLRKIYGRIKYEYELSNEYRTILIHANLRLVVTIAKSYQDCGFPLLDLIQEGNIGLIKGIDEFNYLSGCKISTYPKWWIRNEIVSAIINQSVIFRTPGNKNYDALRLRNALMMIAQENGKDPQSYELDVQTINTLDAIDKLNNFKINIISQEKPLGEETEYSPIKKIANLDRENTCSSFIENFIENYELRRIMKDILLREFNKNEQRFIKLRFGLGYETEHTLEEIGNEINVTRERAMQIETKVLKKLRHAIKKELFLGLKH